MTTKKIEATKKFITATELAVMEQAKYRYLMTYKMAKALLTGEITSEIVRWAEMEVSIYEKGYGMDGLKFEVNKLKEKSEN